MNDFEQLIITGLTVCAVPFNQTEVHKLLSYTQHLASWASKTRLVGYCKPSAIEVHMILESFSFIPLLRTLCPPKNIQCFVDLGSGAGAPGLVVSILLPQLSCISCEHARIKVRFQQFTKHQLLLRNTRLFGAEVMVNTKPCVVVTRAFMSLESMLYMLAACAATKLWICAIAKYPSFNLRRTRHVKHVNYIAVVKHQQWLVARSRGLLVVGRQ